MTKKLKKAPISCSNTDKNIDSDLEALAKFTRDYPSNPIISYSSTNSIRNKIIQFTDICKISPI